MQALEQGRELPARHFVSHNDGVVSQVVDATLDAKTFGIELERSRVAVGHDRLHLAARKRRTFGHCVGERLDSFQEFPVVGHQEPIICRLIDRELWAVRPILPYFGS